MAGTLSTDYSNWYMASGSNVLKPAELAFKEAQAQFEVQGTKDSKKARRLESLNATTLNDVLNAVKDVKQHYDKCRSESKMRRCMEQVSERVHYYGNIMDVLVQHHPEYVSLAWGTMKLLVGAIVEHRKIGSVIANGLLDIADALPRAELASTLYPTDSVKQMVSTLYGHIIRFFLRALHWFEEGSWKRAIHAITKPAPLQYNDILDDIHRVSDHISAHAMAGSQAEQRDMHKELVAIRQVVELGNEANTTEHKDLQRKLQILVNLVGELKIDIRSDQVIAQSERAQIYQSVSSIQITQALHVMSTQCVIDHQANFEVARHLRARRRSTSRVKLVPFWKSRDMQAWNQSSKSSLFTLRVPLASRQPVQDFCTNVIEQLLHARVANLWVLKVQDTSHPVIATLKSLIHQAATFIDQLYRKKDFAVELDRFLHARLEEHYLEVLADLLSSLGVVYIIVQLEAIETPYMSQFILCLQQLIEQLSNRGAHTVVRIIVISWSPGRAPGGTNPTTSMLQLRKSSRRNRTRVPHQPLSITRMT